MRKEAVGKRRNKQSRTGKSNQNKLIADPRIVPEMATGGGKRTLILETERGRLEIDIEMRLVRLMIILSEVLKTELAAPDLADRHRGRVSAKRIGELFGADASTLPVEPGTVVAYVCALNKCIKQAAKAARMPPPQLIDSGFGGYRLVRPLARPGGSPAPRPADAAPQEPARAIA